MSKINLKSELYPILIKGHHRPITSIKFNKDGDFLFTSSKDITPCLWNSQTGELLGTYEGHGGAVWDIEPSWDSSFVLTASGDSSARIFHTTTGVLLSEIPHESPIVKVISWANHSYNFSTLSYFLGKEGRGFISFFSLPEDIDTTSLEEVIPNPIGEIITEDIPQSMKWIEGDSLVAIGFSSGKISLYDTDTFEEVASSQVHTNAVTNLSLDASERVLISSSKDCTACILTPSTLHVVRSIRSKRPVNAAVLSPLHPHVLIGGGQEAIEVTVTKGESGMFETRIFHAIYGDEIAIIPGHFGPIHTIDIHPSGRIFASGSEDGYVRLHHFDDAYISLPHDYVDYMP